MSTHNLCFGSKIRKIGIPLQTPVFYIKVGFKGVYITRACFPDDLSLGYRPQSVQPYCQTLSEIVKYI